MASIARVQRASFCVQILELTCADVQDVAPKNRDLFTDESGGNWLMSHRFANALQSPILFECLILCTLSQLQPGYQPCPGIRQSCLRYRASITNRLRLRLADSQLCLDNVTLDTVTMLMTADVGQTCLRILYHTSLTQNQQFQLGESRYVEIHRAGLRQLVKMRGGLTGGSFDAMTKLSIEL
jgi:hypothetical protein